MLLSGSQGPSRLVTVFLGTLLCSIKDVKSPFMFDGKHGLALHPMQMKWALARF